MGLAEEPVTHGVADRGLHASVDDITSRFSKGALTLEDGSRKALMQACDRLKASLATPAEMIIEMMFTTQRKAAVRLAIEMGVFKAMAKTETSDLAYLAAETGAEASFLVRIMRLVNAIGFVAEVGEGKWNNTPVSKALAVDSGLTGGIIHTSDIHGTVCAHLPAYHRKYGFKNPVDIRTAPFNFAFNTERPLFDWLNDDTFQENAMSDMMAGSWRARGENWFTYYPFVERVQSGPSPSPDAPLFVDVGGGNGTDLLEFKNTVPQLEGSGKFILQDQPSVIATADAARKGGIETQGRDFFTPQPIKGARFYYLRCVLHDWPHKDAVNILKQIRGAMGPESTLLLNEFVVPDVNAHLLAAQNDFIMMTMFGALERTQGQWEDVLNDSGFQLTKIWKAKNMTPADRSLIEAKAKA